MRLEELFHAHLDLLDGQLAEALERAGRKGLGAEGVDQAAEVRNYILSRGFFGGDLGVGVDLGFTYQLNKRLFIKKIVANFLFGRYQHRYHRSIAFNQLIIPININNI